MKAESLPRLELYFDGGCPLCRREIQCLKRRDRQRLLSFVDINAGEFDAGRLGLSQSEFMSKIHARTNEGHWVTGVDVFRQTYERLGFVWLVRFSRVWPIARLLDWAYAYLLAID
jgi:predicted DCC family thiol-disulfide oxidoreductase YuxK